MGVFPAERYLLFSGQRPKLPAAGVRAVRREAGLRSRDGWMDFRGDAFGGQAFHGDYGLAEERGLDGLAQTCRCS